MIELLSCDNSAVEDEVQMPKAILGLCVGDWRKLERKGKSVAKIIQMMEEGKRLSRANEGQEAQKFICY